MTKSNQKINWKEVAQKISTDKKKRQASEQTTKNFSVLNEQIHPKDASVRLYKK